MKQAACVLIVNKLNLHFLSVSLKEDHKDMNLPGGKVEEGETILEAAIRETREETGIIINNLCFLYEEADSEYNVTTFYTYDYMYDYTDKIHTTENHIVKWLPLIELTKSKKWAKYNYTIYKLFTENYKQ